MTVQELYPTFYIKINTYCFHYIFQYEVFCNFLASKRDFAFCFSRCCFTSTPFSTQNKQKEQLKILSVENRKYNGG